MSTTQVISGRHTVLILFAQGNGVDDPIKDFSVASKFTSGMDHRHLDPLSISLKVAFSAFSSITPSGTAL